MRSSPRKNEKGIHEVADEFSQRYAGDLNIESACLTHQEVIEENKEVQVFLKVRVDATTLPGFLHLSDEEIEDIVQEAVCDHMLSLNDEDENKQISMLFDYAEVTKDQ